MRPRENESYPRPLNDWPNPPYANRPEGNKGNFNDNVQLDTSQVQRPLTLTDIFSTRTNWIPGMPARGRYSGYSRATAIRNRARRKK